jgi:hypothetical protein
MVRFVNICPLNLNVYYSIIIVVDIASMGGLAFQVMVSCNYELEGLGDFQYHHPPRYSLFLSLTSCLIVQHLQDQYQVFIRGEQVIHLLYYLTYDGQYPGYSLYSFHY